MGFKNIFIPTRPALATTGLLLVCFTQPAIAGYNASVSAQTGYGWVWSSLSYGALVTASNNVPPTTQTSTPKPSAGVLNPATGYTVTKLPPTGIGIGSTSVVYVANIYGWKAIAKSWANPNPSGAKGDNEPLKQKLASEGFVLTPAACGASYEIASGEEIIDGRRYLIVLGKATGGTAAWFRGYKLDHPATGPEDIVSNGTKLYEALVKGPFDFGEIESPDRCKAMRVPIEYDGPNLYLVADGIAESATDLRFVNCPESRQETLILGCSDTPIYPEIQTSGGCGPVTVTYDPPASALPPGVSTVSVVAVDAVGNSATCQFAVHRPFLTFSGFYYPINGSGGDCTVPIRYLRAGNRIPIKFDTTFCGVAYRSAVPPLVTITKIDRVTCEAIATPIDHQNFQWVANQWYFNWSTLMTDKGRYKIEVELGDGGINPYAIVELR